MKPLHLLIAAIVIVLVPLFYLVGNPLRGFSDDEPVSFRGQSIRVLEANQGTVIIPKPADIKKGALLQSNWNAAFVEELTAFKLADPKGLEMTIERLDTRVTECATDPAKPSRAPMENQIACAADEFARYSRPDKTALFMEPVSKLIAFGDATGSFNKVFHDGWLATYHAPPMTQGDQKRLACQAGLLLDFLFNKDRQPPISCAKAK